MQVERCFWEAGPAGQFVPHPYDVNQIIGGDSVSSIQRRLLDQWWEALLRSLTALALCRAGPL